MTLAVAKVLSPNKLNQLESELPNLFEILFVSFSYLYLLFDLPESDQNNELPAVLSPKMAANKYNGEKSQKIMVELHRILQ